MEIRHQIVHIDFSMNANHHGIHEIEQALQSGKILEIKDRNIR